MLDRYDILIVGGGPGGAAAGTVGARAGLSTLIVEKERYPRDKPCGGGITGRCARAMAEVFGPQPLAQCSLGVSNGVRMSHGPRLVSEVDGCPDMHFVSRWQLDAALIDGARGAGCDVLEGDAAAEVDVAERRVTLASGRSYTGSVIIAADGAGSLVRRSLWPGRAAARNMGVGLVVEPTVADLKDEHRDGCTRVPHTDFGVVPWGYGWVFPHGDRVNIGVGGFVGRGINYRGVLRRLVESYCRPGAWERVQARGHRLPFGHLTRRPGRGPVLLVGDAAGLIEPVTGDGIGFAIESGKLAAQAAAQALCAGAPGRALAIYAAAFRPLYWHMRQASWARWLFFPQPCVRRALRALNRHPQLVRMFMEILAGDLSYPEYFQRMIVGRLRGKL